jgi:hypothetical protein
MNLYPNIQSGNEIRSVQSSSEEISITKCYKSMNYEQFTQVVEAIVEGRYSWACVLILRFADYNPLHYIPYRTYKRLVKENGRSARKRKRENHNQDDHSYSKSNDSKHCSRAFERSSV